MQQDKVIRFLGSEGIAFDMMQLNPQTLNYDRVHYQRPRIEHKVQHYVKEISDIPEDRRHKEMDIALVFERSDGSYWVGDRQHHTDAAVRIGIPLVPCAVVQAKTIEYEQFIFRLFQDFDN